MAKGTSRDLSNNLRRLADWLDDRAEFPVENSTASCPFISYYEKDDFLAAVRAIGTGEKGVGVMDNYLRFKSTTTPEGTHFAVEINREKVCTLVTPAQPAVYDCEPLLSHAEEAEIGK
jgi:hypothetical protein